MQVTQGASFAFHALMQMARTPGASLAIEEMAQSLGASPTYMAKLFQRLARAGLVASRRGRRGGYSLVRPASSITLWEIAVALQDSAAEVPLLPVCASCALIVNCPLQRALRTAMQKTEQELRGVSVAGVVEMLGGGSPRTGNRSGARRGRRSGSAEERALAGIRTGGDSICAKGVAM